MHSRGAVGEKVLVGVLFCGLASLAEPLQLVLGLLGGCGRLGRGGCELEASDVGDRDGLLSNGDRSHCVVEFDGIER